MAVVDSSGDTLEVERVVDIDDCVEGFAAVVIEGGVVDGIFEVEGIDEVMIV